MEDISPAPRRRPLSTLIWTGIVLTLLVASFYLVATRLAPQVDWAAEHVGGAASLGILAGLFVSLGVILPAILTARFVRVARQRNLQPNTGAILVALMLTAPLLLGAGAWFGGSQFGHEIVPERGAWLGARLFGEDAWVVEKADAWLGIGTGIQAADVAEVGETEGAGEDEAVDSESEGAAGEGEAKATPGAEGATGEGESVEGAADAEGTAENPDATGEGTSAEIKVDLSAVLHAPVGSDNMNMNIQHFINGEKVDAAPGAKCVKEAKALLAMRDPTGTAIVNQVERDDLFAFWLQCQDPTFGLGTAVHETTHILDITESGFANSSFFIRKGEMASFPRKTMFPRQEIASRIRVDAVMPYVKTYITGQAGNQDLHAILMELNGYTHGLVTESFLADQWGKKKKISARDGLAAQMYFLELYLRTARVDHPRQWAALAQDEAALQTIQRMWDRAERALAQSESQSKLGIEDAVILAAVYDADNVEELETLFRAGQQTFAYEAPAQ